jgi:hypothetical protein
MTTAKKVEKLERQIKQTKLDIKNEANAYKAIIEKRKAKLAEKEEYLKVLQKELNN